ncbi:MAG: formate/nitrite transporter [Anaerolineae bacterium]|nr:formate/nitrite transporter [Anaerolineae bacterium]
MMVQPEIKLDALYPAEVAQRAEDVGVTKASQSVIHTLVLGILAGAFIALGAVFATTVAAGAGSLPYGVARLLMGFVFCLGLILVVLAGAELFTGNNLIVMAWASRKISTWALLRNWGLVYAANFVGAVGTAALMFVTQQYKFGNGAVGQAALTIANSKVNLEFGQALALGIMCNALVCLAVWLTLGARTTTDKLLAILFPITAFVAMGFEHSIANMYFIPIGLLIAQFDPAFAQNTGLVLDHLTAGGLLNNLIPVTLGNIIGGGGLVAAVYWFAYLYRPILTHNSNGDADGNSPSQSRSG